MLRLVINALAETDKHIRLIHVARIFLNVIVLWGKIGIDFEMEISRVIQSLDQLQRVTKKNFNIQQVDQEKQRNINCLVKHQKEVRNRYGVLKE